MLACMESPWALAMHSLDLWDSDAIMTRLPHSSGGFHSPFNYSLL